MMVDFVARLGLMCRRRVKTTLTGFCWFKSQKHNNFIRLIFSRQAAILLNRARKVVVLSAI
jgi:hypothetical protein